MTLPSTLRSQKSRANRIAQGARQITVVLDAEGAEALTWATQNGQTIKESVQNSLVLMRRISDDDATTSRLLRAALEQKGEKK